MTANSPTWSPPDAIPGTPDLILDAATAETPSKIACSVRNAAVSAHCTALGDAADGALWKRTTIPPLKSRGRNYLKSIYPLVSGYE